MDIFDQIDIPSAEITWPKYTADLGPNASLDGFKVRPAACRATNMLSKDFKWFSHVADITQIIHINMQLRNMAQRFVCYFCKKPRSITHTKRHTVVTVFPVGGDKRCSLDMVQDEWGFASRRFVRQRH